MVNYDMLFAKKGVMIQGLLIEEILITGEILYCRLYI